MEDKKSRIIEAAVRLFKERGFHQVSVRNIIKEAAVSNGCFYHYFATKDELLFSINDFIMDYVIENAQQVLNSKQTPVEKLHGIISTFISTFYVYNREVVVMYQENHYLAPEYYQKMRQKRDLYSKIVMSVLDEGVKLKEFRPLEPLSIVAFMIFGMVNWTYTWYDPEGPLSIEEITDRYIDFIFNAILTEEAKQNPLYRPYFL
ncbi:MAG: TetR/AcrR family transcriptional regulator [Clostridia bacterium]|jgi:AcrR family transcriptional regulator|nr:TetR/AcrR family transcriptional regulator [Clostridia bacterium]